MKFNQKIHIATGLSAKTKIWKNKTLLWSDFVERLKEVTRTGETYKEYMKATKEEQSKIKDVGGFVGGYLRNGRRSPKDVMHRQVITLDLDFAHSDLWNDLTLLFGYEMVLHSTHKHSAENPRYRLIIPIDREVSPEEYVAISRKIAGEIGIDLFDNTTFETNRLMFWASASKDGLWEFYHQEGEAVNADEVLASYIDWKDSSLWSTAESKFTDIFDKARKQEDPEEKRGLIGAFCRTYSIHEAISLFLQDEYTPSAIEERYTYLHGSTAAGLITYDDKFAYSHHGTDPISGKLCNAFDLVRVHKFGHLDTGNEQGTQAKSFKAMEDFVLKDVEVKKTIAHEKLQGAIVDFEIVDEEKEEPTEVESTDWVTELELDSKGNYLSTAHNINTIFSNDFRLRNAFKLNEFDQKRYVFKSLPWRKVIKPEPMRNVDYSGIRNYIETIYGIQGSLKIDDSLSLEIEKQTYHPIKQYLNSIKWDGVPRIDTLLQELFAVKTDAYTSEALRKMLVGAVARVFEPGIKFDLVLVLVGHEQGTGKSSFIKRLAKDWFSDTFLSVSGKEALEQIQGAWIIEMAELSGLKKADVEAVKHFISKQEDTFRPAYTRTPETYYRQCVFFGTTNSKDFLRDPSGNRRFMPIDVHHTKLTDNQKLLEFLENDELLDQIWAEAKSLYENKEPLYLSKEAESIARIEQANHSETDERRGLIENYLDLKLPEDWADRSLLERRDYVNDPITAGKEAKEFVCIAEIWCECLGKERDSMSRYNTREINDIMRSLPNWQPHNSTKNFSLYGKQKYYQRIK